MSKFVGVNGSDMLIGRGRCPTAICRLFIQGGEMESVPGVPGKLNPLANWCKRGANRVASRTRHSGLFEHKLELKKSVKKLCN